MYYFFATILSWVVFMLTCFTVFPVAVIICFVTYPFDRNLRVMHIVSCFWASTLSWLNPLWKVKITGRNKIKSSKPQVIISNHQSMTDILVLYRLFKHFKWVSKAEIFKFPFVGWNMSLNRYVAVERGKFAGHIKMMSQCEKHLKKGSSLMIFPEGTRSKTGEINMFKEGAFHLALNAKVPIVPIVIDGTLDSYPRKGLIFDRHSNIIVRILDPIPYESFEGMSVKETAKMVREIMVKELKEMRV